MSYLKPRFIIPLAVCAALLGWWLTPHYSKEDKAYYVSVFCAIHHDDSSRFEKDMQTVIDGGNSDYALQKINYNAALGSKVFDTWNRLSANEKQSVFSTADTCRTLMNARLD
ncbi:hypothetical protein [Rouxiella chamberiensis]|uniref:Lipoprotein n=1 Tax=Rouxiella chamberiensis TaxID=1513468 RepID=A0ABY7HRD3_9GAMM|nr:hypothetical protein [Rouxiella chamberiensis]WAT01948.1 hypothetical protein O1V66_04415 [Rouxiella chamberiensis]